MPVTLVASEHVLVGDDAGLRPATLVVEGDLIAAVHDGIDPAARLVDAALLPGFVDTHCHGARGVAFGTGDPAPAIAHHHLHGSTSLMASTVTASMADLRAQLDTLRPAVEAGDLVGVHLEGPFLSREKKGAHEDSLLRTPDPELLDPLLADPVVRMVTLAPELLGGLQAMCRCRAAGVVAAFGHSDADATTARAALDAGATVTTHLFNAMRPIGHREPGPVPVLLHDPRMVVELIADGVHVAPEVLLMTIDAVGAHRVALVTDAIAATGEPDGPQHLGNLPIQVRHGIARLVDADGLPGALAGSTLTLDRAVQRLVGLGVPLADVARMASTTPARAHGLDRVGVLEPGRLADVCAVDAGGHLRGVMRHGTWLRDPHPANHNPGNQNPGAHDSSGRQATGPDHTRTRAKDPA